MNLDALAARNLAVDDRHVDGEGAAPDRAAADLGGRPPTAPPGPTLMNAARRPR